MTHRSRRVVILADTQTHMMPALAREMARRNPTVVRNVITLGSPHGDPRATNAWRLYEAMSGNASASEGRFASTSLAHPATAPSGKARVK